MDGCVCQSWGNFWLAHAQMVERFQTRPLSEVNLSTLWNIGVDFALLVAAGALVYSLARARMAPEWDDLG